MTDSMMILTGALLISLIVYLIHKKRQKRRGAKLYTIGDHQLFLASREEARRAAARNWYRRI